MFSPESESGGSVMRERILSSVFFLASLQPMTPTSSAIKVRTGRPLADRMHPSHRVFNL